jgi:7,8-dihydropterin-6-yl-methyl-4-(beta-D-ribofuranosyl)aminobenzene 5'-phosphate synthase
MLQPVSGDVKITFLVENNTSSQCEGEHGLSLLIEAEQKILFDAGQSRLFLDNAARLGLALSDTDMIVLSHGHYDHGNGLEYVNQHRLIAHPGIFTRRYREKNHGYIGLKFNREQLESRFQATFSTAPLFISNSMVFLGQIPRQNSFESQSTTFIDEAGNPDFVADDSGMAILTGTGLIVISGCAHSGICNTIDHAMQITGERRIAAVIGGFHLKNGSPALAQTADYLGRLSTARLYPCHCVDEEVLQYLHRELDCQKVFSGLSVIFKG